MKRKFLILLASLLTIIFVMSACGKDNPENTDNALTDSETSDTESQDTSSDTGVTDTTSTIVVDDHCDHDWQETKVTGTCLSEGSITYTCSSCGETKTENFTSLPHLEETTVNTQPSCGKDGTMVVRCTRCGTVIRIEDIPTTIEHDMAFVETVEKTCTKGGYDLWECKNGCGKQEYRNMVLASHEWVEEVVAPTCTDQGYTVKKCSVCGESQTLDYVDTIDHDWQDDRVIEPTCDEQGYTIQKCSYCDEMQIVNYVDKKGHHWQDETVEPTCTEKGYTGQKCLNCGKLQNVVYVDAIGHTPSETAEITESTCQTNGTIIYRCITCNEPAETQTLPKADHDFSKETEVETLPADCTNNERIVYSCKWTSDGCTETLTVDKDGGEKALGHDIDYDNVIADVGASCSQYAYLEYKCKRCDQTVKKAKNGAHEWDGDETKTEVVEPTCFKQGYTIYVCKNCNEHYNGNFVAATGNHVFDENGAYTVEPTCTSEGYTAHKCISDPDCTAIDKQELVARTAHNIPYSTSSDLYCSICENSFAYIRETFADYEDPTANYDIFKEEGLTIVITGSVKDDFLKFVNGTATWNNDSEKVITEGMIFVSNPGDATFKFEYKDAQGTWHTVDSAYVHEISNYVYADLYKYADDGISGIRVTVLSGNAENALIDIYQ